MSDVRSKGEMLQKRVAGVLLVVSALAVWSGCGRSGPRLPDVVLRPGEAVDFEHEVSTTFTDELITSCTISAGEVLPLDVDVYSLSIGTHECFALVTIFAYPDAPPGQYLVPVRFDYTWFDEQSEFEGEASEDSSILVEVRP